MLGASKGIEENCKTVYLDAAEKRRSLLNLYIHNIYQGMTMAIEWTAQTDVLTCEGCGNTITPGEVVVGDFDQFFHKETCKE